MPTVSQEELFPAYTENSAPPADQYPSAFLERPENAPRLERIQIDGLKGFDRSTLHVAPFTLLTGPNNSGKSTVLQAIALGFECFRRSLDTTRWSLRSSGRAVTEFEFLPVNEPKDLWYETTWKPSRDKERYIRVTLHFSNGFAFAAKLRFLFGTINLGVDVVEGDADEAVLRALAASAPVLIPATPGPGAHEDYYPLAQIHRFLNMREPSRVLRNVLFRLHDQAMHGDSAGLDFLNYVLWRYFRTELREMSFDEARDLEVRAPLQKANASYSLDVVSAGSGLNQMLMLAAVLAWRRPGIVLLDEPDAHLHSSVQAQLLDFLMALADEFRIQVIAATHSRDLISRAPLQAIVPVDRTREEIRPLQSLEHLLLEYGRHGTVTNVDLALLYQTRRCVFVEGRTDAELLPRIAEKLGFDLFVGHDQIVPFEIGGVGKVKLVPELVKLFRRLIGADLRWGVVRDSDANIPEVKAKVVEQADELGFPVFHLWSRYSLENYLLEPELICAAVKRLSPDIELGTDAVEALLCRAIEDIEDDIGGLFVTNTQNAFRDILGEQHWYNDGAVAATKYLRTLTGLEDRLHAYPGKRIFGRFVQYLQDSMGVHLRIDDVVAVLTPDNAPTELLEALRKLDDI